MGWVGESVLGEHCDPDGWVETLWIRSAQPVRADRHRRYPNLKFSAWSRAIAVAKPSQILPFFLSISPVHPHQCEVCSIVERHEFPTLDARNPVFYPRAASCSSGPIIKHFRPKSRNVLRPYDPDLYLPRKIQLAHQRPHQLSCACRTCMQLLSFLRTDGHQRLRSLSRCFAEPPQ